MMATTETTEGHGKIILADETYLIRGAVFEVYKELLPEHRAQLINYLKVTQKPLGLLINFNSHPHVKIERYVL
jgi:hypothetical protein